jgi:hypothetical protein
VLVARSALCGGVALCFGASIVTLGSEPEFVCDTAGTLKAQSNAVDRIATADGATRLDDNLMTETFVAGGTGWR